MKTKICIFGDSIVWDGESSKNSGWVLLLSNFFKENDEYNIAVYNQGMPGDSTNDLLKRFEHESSVIKPQIIIFAIGINDSHYFGSKDNPYVQIDEFRDNLEKLIDKAENFSNKIIFIGLTKVDENKVCPIPNSEEFYDNGSILEYNLAIEEICGKHKLSYVGMFDLLETFDLEDGLHPNIRGYKKMYIRIKDFLLNNKIYGIF